MDHDAHDLIILPRGEASRHGTRLLKQPNGLNSLQIRSNG